MPDPSEIDYMEEPMVSAEIMVTTEFVGPIMKFVRKDEAYIMEWNILSRQGTA